MSFDGGDGSQRPRFGTMLKARRGEVGEPVLHSALLDDIRFRDLMGKRRKY